MTPLKTLVLGVFAASSLSVCTVWEAASKDFREAFCDAAIAAVAAYGAKGSYRNVRNAMEQASSKPAPNIEPTIMSAGHVGPHVRL